MNTNFANPKTNLQTVQLTTYLRTMKTNLLLYHCPSRLVDVRVVLHFYSQLIFVVMYPL